MGESRDYENGVADVLAFLGGPDATVERNVYLPGHLSKKPRQIDIVVRGRFGGVTETTLVVDCKRHVRPVDVKTVESFIGAVEDVGAALGMIVASNGMTGTARQRVAQQGRVSLEVISVDELKAWRPPGTFTSTHRIPAQCRAAAEKLLNEAGYRVIDSTSFPHPGGEVILDILRHYGNRQPPVEDQRRQLEQVELLLRQTGAEPINMGHGIIMLGGDPGQRWIEVAIGGHPTGYKVIAGDFDEANKQLDGAAETLGVPRELLTVIAPDGWPVTGVFGTWRKP